MIDLEPIYSNSNIVNSNLIFVLLLLLVATVVIVCLIYKIICGKLKVHKRSRHYVILGIVVSVVFFLFTTNIYPINYNKYDNEQVEEILRENIKSKYGLDIANDTINIFDLKDNIPSSKYYATFNNDNRVYEVYMIKKNNNLSLYTRNEKGVYIPVTTMMNNDQ